MKTQIPIQLRFGDLDAYGHVNNVAVAGILEEARTRVLWSADAHSEMNFSQYFSLKDPNLYLLIASQTIDYHAMMPYTPHPVVVSVWVGRIGGSSFEFHCQIRSSQADETLYAQAIITIVLVDATTERPVRIAEDARRALQAWQDEPLKLGR
jgi:acyl-CoA thioester hydrolase